MSLDSLTHLEVSTHALSPLVPLVPHVPLSDSWRSERAQSIENLEKLGRRYRHLSLSSLHSLNSLNSLIKLLPSQHAAKFLVRRGLIWSRHEEARMGCTWRTAHSGFSLRGRSRPLITRNSICRQSGANMALTRERADGTYLKYFPFALTTEAS